MGEKYSPEKLAAMRSIGYLSRGRTVHTNAGTIRTDMKEVRDDTGELTRKTLDDNNAVITEHQDGRQDVEMRPQPIEGKMATN